MLNNSRIVIVIVALLLLCIPAIEMLDGTSDIQWSAVDFLMAFFLLSATGFSIEWVYRKIKSPGKKRILIALIVLLLLLVWAELAVGIFNTPIAGD